MLAIRLRRTGSKKRPFFRVVVTDSRAARDSSFVEVLGHYNPRTKPETLDAQARAPRALGEARRARRPTRCGRWSPACPWRRRQPPTHRPRPNSPRREPLPGRRRSGRPGAGRPAGGGPGDRTRAARSDCSSSCSWRRASSGGSSAGRGGPPRRSARWSRRPPSSKASRRRSSSGTSQLSGARWSCVVGAGRPRPHGIRGQVIVNPETDFSGGRSGSGRRCSSAPPTRRRAAHRRRSRFHQGRPILGARRDRDDGRRRAAGRRRAQGAGERRSGRCRRARSIDHDLVGCEVRDTSGRGWSGA